MATLFSEIDLKSTLNEAQYKAVTTNHRAVLVLAGAGSGKTRVITYRIARLLGEGVRPYQILALTFTNKAAGEMKGRIEQLTGPGVKQLWMSTFHSISAKLLRREITALGRPSDFAIYDTSDSEAVIRECLTEMNLSQKDFSPRALKSSISYFKSHLLSPEQAYTAIQDDGESDSPYNQVLLRVYPRYEKHLEESSALDFDDLLLYPLRLFKEHPEILEKYQSRFRHILVDEYQDTNRAQYELIQMLAQKAETICVVGDDDQSIYRWRGALIENLDRFRDDFAPVEVITLEDNYRSTSMILEAATSVVNVNQRRRPKLLKAKLKGTEPVYLLVSEDEQAEAQNAISLIEKWTRKSEEWNFNDCAIFFRTVAQSRSFEEVLMRRGIPYTLVGGIRFYERKEIKDILSYVRAAVHPKDEQAWRRISGLGHWKVGSRTLDLVLTAASEQGKTTLELSEEELGEILNSRTLPHFKRLQQTILKWSEALQNPDLLLSQWITQIVVQSEYLTKLSEQKSDRDAKRQIETVRINLEQLVSATGEFSDQLANSLDPESDKPSLSGELEIFLSQCSLMSDIDYWKESDDPDSQTEDLGRVVLMTLHSAKGLEFPIAIIAGCEEDLIPHSRSAMSLQGLEEERRLLYVGMTRAMQKLVLSYTHTRRVFGRSTPRMRSSFLDAIPTSCLEKIGFEPPKIESSSNKVFKRGDYVLHQHFGKGEILSVSGEGAGKKVRINFFRHGQKTIMLAYAKMRKL